MALEDFPPTVAAWRKRQDKWIRGTAGTADWLRREAGRFLKAPHIPLREKADMLLNAGWLYLAPPGLVWFAGMALMQPSVMARVRQPVELIQGPAWNLGPDFWHWLDGLRLTLLWSWPLCGVMLFLMLAPVVPALMAWMEDRRRTKEGRKAGKLESRLQAESTGVVPEPPGLIIPPEGGTPTWTGGAVLRFWIAGSYLWLSSLVVETVSLLVWMFTGRARFDNTGDTGRGPGWRVYHANHPLVHLLELAAGGWFLWKTWLLVNPWLAVPGVALVTAPLAARVGWECRVVRFLALLPLLIGLGMFGLTIRELLRR